MSRPSFEAATSSSGEILRTNQILLTLEDGMVHVEGNQTNVNGEEAVDLPLFTRTC